jgi:hypothetical protein
MKILKLAIAALFAAGLITASASAGFAADKDVAVSDCAEGSVSVAMKDGSLTCEEATPALFDESGSCFVADDGSNVCAQSNCWVTPEGGNVCARGFVAPTPVTGDETLTGPTECFVSTDEAGMEINSCAKATLFEATDEGSVSGMTEDGGPINPDLMLQNGVALSAGSPTDNSSSNSLAAFGVLIGALGALGIGLSKQRATK